LLGDGVGVGVVPEETALFDDHFGGGGKDWGLRKGMGR
jgi:hypothetical protein